MNNPYEPPKSDDIVNNLVDATDDKFRVDNKYLVIKNGAILPRMCIKCGSNTNDHGERYTKILNYASPFIYLLFLVNILILLIVYLLVRKQVTLTYSLCGFHVSRKKTMFSTAVAVSIATVLIFIASFVFEIKSLLIIGMVSLIASVILLIVATKRPQPIKHVDGEFWIQGCGPELLDFIRNNQKKSSILSRR